jgi:hypothetical protein
MRSTIRTARRRFFPQAQGFVDTGHGHIGRNELGTPAKDVSVAIAPVNASFRTDLPANANPACGF